MAESWGWDQPEESAGHRSNTSAPAAGCTTFLKHIVLCVWPTSCDLIKWIRWILQMFTFLALDTRGSERFGSHADVFTAHELPETWRRSLCLFRRTLACVCDVMFWRSAIITQWYISLCTLRDFNCLKCSAARMQVCSLTLGRVNPRLCWNVTFIYAATLHLEHLLWSPQNRDANCPEVSLKSVLWRHQTKCWNTTLWPESQVINSPDSHIRSGKKKKKGADRPSATILHDMRARRGCLVKFSYVVNLARKPETPAKVNVNFQHFIPTTAWPVFTSLIDLASPS